MISDKYRITILLVVTGLLAVLSQFPIFFISDQSDVYVSNYTVILHSNLFLEETYTYKINVPEKHFLYRYWKTRLAEEPLNQSHIQILDISPPPNSVGYFKDYRGDVILYNSYNPEALSEINHNAYLNEVGAYNAMGYTPGEYSVKYWFKIIPPLEEDDEFIHLNMKLADQHIPYEKVIIMIEDIDHINSVFLHPPTFKESRIKNMRIFTGESDENELLEFELLLFIEAKEFIDGYYQRVEGVKSLTLGANNIIKREYLIAQSILWLTKISGFLMPLIFVIIWFRYGVEKEYTVPRFLSTIPVKNRKPWIVNLVFKKGVTDFDEDGFYATLIDMHLKDKLKIIQEDDNLLIQILSEKGLDSYESDVMSFLKELAVDNLVTSEFINNIVEKAKKEISSNAKVFQLKYAYQRLVEGSNNQVSSEYTESGRKKLIIPGLYAISLIIVTFFGYILSNNTENILFRAMGYSWIPILQIGIAALFPSTLFGCWKEDYYWEKLQWDAFKRHLTDFSMIEKYGTEDLNIWGTWLVYGTSLGVGKQVSEAIKKLEIPIDIATFSKDRALFKPILLAQFPSSGRTRSRSRSFSSRSYSSSGGGFGGGRGFGGGGGGVR